MNILLLSMPDSFEHMPPIAVRVSDDVPAADGVQNRMAHTIASATGGISLCVSSEAIEANPRTPMSQQFRDDGLIVDEDVAHYDGTTAVVRGKYLPALEIEFLRWRAERGMKLKHLPAAFLHSHSS
jgi:hypothetical protein